LGRSIDPVKPNKHETTNNEEGKHTMKAGFLLTAVQNGAKRIATGLVFAVAGVFLHQDAKAISIVDFGAASSFSVLAGSAITDNGGTFANASKIITGNVGVYPGTSDGLFASQVTGGTIYARPVDDGLLLGAKNAFGAANTTAAGETPFTSLAQELGGQTLVPGVYRMPTLALLNGILTLDGTGYTDPVWIFQGTDSLVTKAGAPGLPGSSIKLVNATACDVLWEIPTQATLGTYSDFVGTIMAGSAIVMGTGATLHGRAWAEAQITLDDNTITGLPCTSLGGTGGTKVPDTGSTLLLLGSGLATLSAFRRRLLSPA
jgi:hypothetical protein